MNKPTSNQSTAVEPALLNTCLAFDKQEPAQAVPVAWKHDCAALLTNNVELWIDACPHCGKPRSAPPAIDDETCKMALLIREAVNKGIFQGAMHMDAISILSRLTIFHGGENDSSR